MYIGNYFSFEKMRLGYSSRHVKTYEIKERRRREVGGFIDQFGSEARGARHAQSH